MWKKPKELTFEERLTLRRLANGPQPDRDRVSDRFLVGSGLAERFGIGELRITELGHAWLAAAMESQP